MKEPILFTSASSPTQLFACAVCKNFLTSSRTYGEGEGAVAQAYAVAAHHCDPKMCDEKGCTAQVAPHALVCEEHRHTRAAKRERDKLKKATVVPWAEYKGDYVYYPGLFDDGYLRADALEDEIAELLLEDRAPPTRVWSCVERGLPKFDALELVSNHLESCEAYEGAIDEIRNMPWLQDKLDRWIELQAIVSCHQDERVAIDITQLVEDVRKSIADTFTKEDPAHATQEDNEHALD